MATIQTGFIDVHLLAMPRVRGAAASVLGDGRVHAECVFAIPAQTMIEVYRVGKESERSPQTTRSMDATALIVDGPDTAVNVLLRQDYHKRRRRGT